MKKSSLLMSLAMMGLMVFTACSSKEQCPLSGCGCLW